MLEQYDSFKIKNWDKRISYFERIDALILRLFVNRKRNHQQENNEKTDYYD